ncbi:hypothetical protein diail_6848 [Diaporthe ilicicola]|nr:hypothetical protein diail_6848 [Diaporthe ilicicola]
MKSFLAILSLVSAALAAGTCLAESGCAGCGQVDTASFVQNGQDLVATSVGWATMTISNKKISLKNVSSSTLTVCDWSSTCYLIGPNSECSADEPSNFNTDLGLQIWQHNG